VQKTLKNFAERIICPRCNKCVTFADVKTVLDDEGNFISVLHCSKCGVLSSIKILVSSEYYYKIILKT